VLARRLGPPSSELNEHQEPGRSQGGCTEQRRVDRGDNCTCLLVADDKAPCFPRHKQPAGQRKAAHSRICVHRPPNLRAVQRCDRTVASNKAGSVRGDGDPVDLTVRQDHPPAFTANAGQRNSGRSVVRRTTQRSRPRTRGPGLASFGRLLRPTTSLSRAAWDRNASSRTGRRIRCRPPRRLRT